jgi:hypothetical protein
LRIITNPIEQGTLHKLMFLDQHPQDVQATRLPALARARDMTGAIVKELQHERVFNPVRVLGLAADDTLIRVMFTSCLSAIVAATTRLLHIA